MEEEQVYPAPLLLPPSMIEMFHLFLQKQGQHLKALHQSHSGVLHCLTELKGKAELLLNGMFVFAVMGYLTI